MPILSKTDEVNLLLRAMECFTQPEGWHPVLDCIDSSLNCRSLLTEFDKNGTPTGQFGGFRSANDLGKVLQHIETASGRNTLQFMLNEAALFYPYCKTSLERGGAMEAYRADERLDDGTSSPQAGSAAEDGEEDQASKLLPAPGLISPIWRSGNSVVLFACLFTAYTPDNIDVCEASKTFRTIVQALTPALNVHFKLNKERSGNQIKQALISRLDCPAILMTADRQILDHTPAGLDRLVQTGAAAKRGQKLVFKHKQVEAAFQDLQAMSGGQGEPQSVCVTENDGSLNRISIEPVQAPMQISEDADSTWYIISFSETAELPEGIEGVLQAHYDLSQSEARFARQLTLTGSMTSTADLLGITRNTAKTHLRRIYEKTGVHTQLQLAGLVHRLAGLF